MRSHRDPLFHGAQILPPRARTVAELAAALVHVPELEAMPPSTVAVACDIAAGVPALALDLLAGVRALAPERGGEHPGLVVDAFIALVAASSQRLALSVELARELHRLGPAVLRSIAVGVPP